MSVDRQATLPHPDTCLHRSVVQAARRTEHASQVVDVVTSSQSVALAMQARLKGALRRLDIPSIEEFDEGEYAEAADAVYKAVSGVCSQSRCVLQDVVVINIGYSSHKQQEQTHPAL